MNKDDFRAELKSFLGVDDQRFDFLESLFSIYIEHLNKSLRDLISYHQNNKQKEFASLIHKMKGSALTYSASPIVKECNKIEIGLGSDQKLSNIKINGLIDSAKHLNCIYSGNKLS